MNNAKKLFISLISLIIALVLAFVFIIPLWDTLGLLKTNLSNKEAELKKLETRAQKVSYLKKEYQSMEGEVQKVFLALPREEDIPNLLIQFEALASSNGLILDSISFGQLQKKRSDFQQQQQQPTTPFNDEAVSDLSTKQIQPTQTPSSSFLRNLNVGVSLSGRYDNFKKYLDSLTNSIRSMSVQSISFNAAQSSGEKEIQADSFTFNLSVNVHYQ